MTGGRDARFAIIMVAVLAMGVAACSQAPGGSKSNALADADVFVEPKLLKSEKLRLWPEAASVRLFVQDIPRDAPNRPDHGMSNPAGVTLTKAQQALVSNALTRETYDDHPSAWACFIPHHFFHFYDAAGKQIGELRVCYCCRGVELRQAQYSLSDKQGWGFDYDGVAKMMAEMGISSEVQCGPG